MLKKPGKQYGLIKKKKPETKLVASKLSFFNDDDDEDEGLDEKKRIEKELKKTAAQKKVNKQTQVNIPPKQFPSSASYPEALGCLSITRLDSGEKFSKISTFET